MDDCLIFRQIYAERFVSSDKRFLPPNVRSQVAERLVGLRSSCPDFLWIQTPDVRNLSLDDVFFHDTSKGTSNRTTSCSSCSRVDVKRGCDKMADMPLYMGD